MPAFAGRWLRVGPLGVFDSTKPVGAASGRR
jgi:hypothetical protein